MAFEWKFELYNSESRTLERDACSWGARSGLRRRWRVDCSLLGPSLGGTAGPPRASICRRVIWTPPLGAGPCAACTTRWYRQVAYSNQASTPLAYHPFRWTQVLLILFTTSIWRCMHSPEPEGWSRECLQRPILKNLHRAVLF